MPVGAAQTKNFCGIETTLSQEVTMRRIVIATFTSLDGVNPGCLRMSGSTHFEVELSMASVL